MSLLRAWFLRLGGLFGKERRDRDLVAELESHIQMHVDDNVRSGMTPQEARRQALIKIGGFEQTKDTYRDRRGIPLLETTLQDLRYGLRMLRKNPGFTSVAVLTLALGIGANTAIFSVVNGVLLRPLPFPRQDRLMMVWEKDAAGRRSHVGWATVTDWNKLNHSFTGIAAISQWLPTLIGANDAQNLMGFRVSADFFDVMSVQPEYGRGFVPSEDVRGNQFVVVLSHGLWQRRFGSDTAIVGKSIRLGSLPYTVIGVLPADFPSVFSTDPGKPADIYAPLAYDATLPYACRDCRHLRAVARLKDGVSMSQAGAEMDQISESLFRLYPTEYESPGTLLTSLKDFLVGNVRPVLWALLGSVGFVLMIACVNVANLLVGWAARRQREVAVRAALGAGRTRLIRQFLTESILISFFGGAFGLFLAIGGVRLVQRLKLGNLPRLQNVHVDGSVFAFTLGISLLAGIAFGLAPAFRASKLDLNRALKETGKSTAGIERNRLRNLLVLSDVALALVLLTGAGLMMKSFVHLLDVNPGFDPSHTLTLGISLWGPKADDAPAAAFYQQVVERVRALPGVESAGVVSQLPLGGNLDMYGLHIEGQINPNPEKDPSGDRYSISPGYLRALRIPLISGREIDEQDRASSPLVVLINDSTARQFWPGENPIGRRLKMGDTKGPWRTVVGVVGDVLHKSLDAPHTLQIYLPHAQFTDSDMLLVVRTSLGPSSLAATVRGTIAAIDPQAPIASVATMEEIVSASVAQQRFGVLLFGLFAAIALALAAVGMYGVISYGVAQRTHEIGIRMALGARRSDVLHLIVGEGMKPAFVGTAIGLGAAFGLTRLLTSLLYGVTPTDPVVFASVSALLVGVALLACYIPARRAVRVDAMTALRYE
jgi:putative ABC transport system permease protein